MNKKSSLIIIIVFEVILGTIFLYKVYENRFIQSKVLGAQEVTLVKKAQVIKDQSDKLEYYLTLGFGEWEEQPDWLSYKVVYHINEDGLREFNDYEVEKPEGIYRIIALGDSYTYGHHVNAEDGWTKQLEQMLSKDPVGCGNVYVEVINLGMPGFDVQHTVQRFKEIGEKYNPNLVLWFESGYGFSRHTELVGPMIEECYESSTELQRQKDQSEYYEYARCSNEAYKKLYQRYTVTELNKFIQDSYDIFFSLENTKNTIMFYYKNIPKEDAVIFNNLQKKYKTATFVPLIPPQTEEDQLPDGHPSKLGHEIIASHIFDYLKNQRVLCL